MVRLRFETDLSTSLKAGADLANAYKKVGEEVKGSVREMNALEKAAKRLVDQNLTPQEKYNQKLEQMAKAVKAGKLSMEDAERTAARLRTKLDETARSGAAAFGASAISDLKGYVLGLGSVSGAMALVTSEIQRLKAEAEKTNQAQTTGAGARDVLKRNAAFLGINQARAVEARADKLAGELGLSQKHIDPALAEALSSSPDVDTAFSRVRTAGQYLKTKPEGIGEFSGALGDVALSTRDPDSLRNLGFLLSVGGQSRVSDDQKLAASLPKALAGATTYGATAEEGGALFDALSRAAADTEGRESGTGVIHATQRSRKFFDELIAKGKASKDIDTFAERLEAMRANPELAKQFMANASFEAKVAGPLEQFFLNPNSPIAKEYEGFKGSFGTREDQIARAKGTLGYLNEGRMANAAAVERTIAARTEQFRLGEDAELSSGSRDEVFERTRRLRNVPGFLNTLNLFARTGSTMSPQEAITELESGQAFAAGRGDQELVKNTQAMIDELKALNKSRQTLTAPAPHGRAE